MAGLFTTMATAANSLTVYDRVLATIGNNVNNSGTPGYARQRLSTVAQPFDPVAGLSGGVAAGDLESFRSFYAESAVWRNEFEYATSDQLATELSNIEALFDVTGESGIPGALNDFFSKVSSWSVSANDSVARATVLDSADLLAQQFNSMVSSLDNASNAVDDRIRSTVDSINSLAGEIAGINKELMSDASSQDNPAIDTRLYNALESLSEYVDFTVLKQGDGTLTVLAGGQTPLVIGPQSYSLSSETADTSAALFDSEGRDITSQISGGRLSALYGMRNSILPDYENQLNQLAAGIADSVNNLLASGVDQNGDPGAALFSYDSAANAAFTLKLTGIQGEQLAAASASAPGGSAIALDLVAMAESPQIGDLTFTEFYSQLASQFGQTLEAAQESADTNSDLVVQARSMRSDISGVSLDEEAAQLLQYQRGYQAIARLVSILNELTESTMEMMR